MLVLGLDLGLLIGIQDFEVLDLGNWWEKDLLVEQLVGA